MTPLPGAGDHSTGRGNDTIIGSECSDFIQPGGGNDFVDGNGPDFAQACAFQDDILATWSFFLFGGLACRSSRSRLLTSAATSR